MNSRILKHPVFIFSEVIVVLTVGQWLLGRQINSATEIAIYALYAAGFNILFAYTGLVPFGMALFFGAGMYVAGYLAIHVLAFEPFVVLAAALIVGVSSLAIGYLVLRRGGIYFSLLTLGFSQIGFEIAQRWSSVTGGENGMQNVPREIFQSDTSFHWFVVVSVGVLLLIMRRVMHAPIGRVLQAIRDNNQRAEFLGYNVRRYKLFSFATSAAFVAYAGGLFALMLRGAYPNVLEWQHAGDPLFMAIFGGVYNFLGPLWGAIAFVGLQENLSRLLNNWWLVFAPIIMIFVLAFPSGLHAMAQRFWGVRQWTLVDRRLVQEPLVIEPLKATSLHLDPTKPILSARGISKNFGELVTAKNIDFDIYPCQLHALIGPNGAGKTTLFNILTGSLAPSAGTVLYHGKDVTRLPPYRRIRGGMSRSFQIISLFRNLTVFESARVAAQAGNQKWYRLWLDAYADAATVSKAWTVLAAVGLKHKANEVCSELNHGELRLLDIAITLANDADLIFLDEPLAGLAESDRKVISKLVRELAHTRAIFLVEHDVDRVIELSDRISVLHRGKLIADGLPADIISNEEVQTAYLGSSTDKGWRGRLDVHRAPDVGEDLLVVANITAGYNGGVVLDGVNLTVRKGEVIAVLGRNGVGKTTLLRAITGVVKAQQGTIKFDGRDITSLPKYQIIRSGISVVPEGRRLFPNLTVMDNLRIAQRAGGATFGEVFQLFPKLNLLQNSHADRLSGGERQMLAIARSIMAPSRMILLDEPFEGLAPAIVMEVMQALGEIRKHRSVVIVEHKVELMLMLADRVVILVNGRVAYQGDAEALASDKALQARLLGISDGQLASGSGSNDHVVNLS